MVSHNYYLKIVPTVYTNATSQVLSNQYSVYEVSRPVQMSAFGQITSLPGVFFVYDITPFMHSISERHMSLAHFLVRICAVIGGVAAVRPLLSRLMSRLRSCWTQSCTIVPRCNLVLVFLPKHPTATGSNPRCSWTRSPIPRASTPCEASSSSSPP